MALGAVSVATIRMDIATTIASIRNACHLERTKYTFPVVKPASPRRRKSEPEHASSLVADVVASIGGDKRGREQRVFSIYENVGGDFLRKHTRPDSLRDRTLIIRVESSAIAHHVTLLRGEILQRMTPLLPPGMVADIRTRVGRLD